VYSVVIGGIAGIALAAATSFRVTRWLLDPLITVGYAIPKIGLISVYIILLGVNTASHIALVASTIIFVYFLAMRQALVEVDEAYLNAFRLLGASRLRIGMSLVLPTAIPHLLGASRIAVPLGLATAVFAELRVPTEGLGALLGNFTYFTSIAQSVAVALFIVVVAYVIDLVFGEALRRYNELLGARVV
jgi:ABC-type nitrate/sulfonate/bicarbonate transport system permease component